MLIVDDESLLYFVDINSEVEPGLRQYVKRNSVDLM